MDALHAIDAIETLKKFLIEDFIVEDCDMRGDDMHWTCASCRAVMLRRELSSLQNEIETLYLGDDK